MYTFFAPADRSNSEEIKNDVEFISKNPIIDELLHSVSGLLAVLNSNRQILAVNDLLVKTLNIDDPDHVLGLRPGEALKCRHACDMPGGCGTGPYCSTCGAVISIVTSLSTDLPAERECALTTEENGVKRDIFLRVRSVPVTYENRRLVLLFLQDITYQQKLAALERVFFHDIKGIIQALVGASEFIAFQSDENTRDIARTIQSLSMRLANEITIQQRLNKDDASRYQPVYSSIAVSEVYREISDMFDKNPVRKNKSLEISREGSDIVLTTEPSLLIRILRNMVTNAFEATGESGEVKVWHETAGEGITFCVWNRNSVPPDVAKRIFQRNFSTKGEMGRGLGTYSMKLFGEDILGGHVDFTSSEQEGTVFRFSMNAKNDFSLDSNSSG